MFSIIENRILKLMTNHQWNNIYGLLNSEKFLCRIREKKSGNTYFMVFLY